MAMHLPRHGLKVESVPSKEPKEKIKTDLPTRSKWQIGLCLWYKPYRGGAACRRGSEASPSGDSKGHSPWRAFGDFPRVGKVTRVQGGAPAGGCRDYQSRINSRGADHGKAMISRSARIKGGVQRRALALLAKGECRGALPLCTPLDFWRAIEYTITES